MINRIVIALLASTLNSCTTWAPYSQIDGPIETNKHYLAQVLEAEKTNQTFTPISELAPDTTLLQAYDLQRQYVAKRVTAGDRRAGFKGGLMSNASLRARGVSEPLVGILFHSGRAVNGATISLCDYRRASFELKLGFIFKTEAKALVDVASLKRSVRSVVPVVDLPDIAYRNPDKYSAVDMVAANVSAFRWVIGSEADSKMVDLDNLRVTMTHNDKISASGLGRESLDNQWNSLLTLVKQIESTGSKVRGGDLVITGKIGERGWLAPGYYEANYNELGKVFFTVKPCKTEKL